MKAAADTGFWFLVVIIIIILAALLAGIYWRLYRRKPERLFRAAAVGDFRKRFPNLYDPAFEPVITVQNRCCGTFLWMLAVVGNGPYFCNQCGSECGGDGKKKENGLNLAEINKQLADMPVA